jgi:hypothetical protein
MATARKKAKNVVLVVGTTLNLNQSIFSFDIYGYSCFHRYRRRKNRLLMFVYVPSTSAAQNRLLFFFSDAAVYSTNEANKAGLKQSIIFRCLWLLPNVRYLLTLVLP